MAVPGDVVQRMGDRFAMDEGPDQIVARIAAVQRGLVSRRQALDAGMTARMIDRRLGAGRWSAPLPGVYALAGSPDDRLRRLWAASLNAGEGCALALHTAGRLHGFEEAVDRPEISLLVPSGRRHPPPGILWRRQIDVTPDDVVTLDGLPVTSVPRTAMDLAASISVTRLRRLVESAVVSRGFDVADFGVVLDRVRRSGKTGVRTMERVLDSLGPGDGIPRSELERLLDRAIEAAGLPPPRHEHPLPGAVDRPGFVDRCWPEIRLIAEADGRRWHTRRQQIQIDHDRVLDAQAAGFQTSQYLWEHLHGDPDGSSKRLRAIYEQRSRDTLAASSVDSLVISPPKRW